MNLSARTNPRAGTPALRLFCFPYAGGGAQVFRAWPGELPPWVEVCAVQPPGRGARMSEPPYKRMTELVPALADALAPALDVPFSFFGHGLGALVAFETARRLREERGVEPALLAVSAQRAPQLPRTEPPAYDLPDDEFVELLRRLRGTPDEVLAHPELLNLMLPILRADFELAETYAYAPAAPLACPVVAFGGLADHRVRREELEAWREQTGARFMLRMFTGVGDHFFINEHRALLLRSLAQELWGIAGGKDI